MGINSELSSWLIAWLILLLCRVGLCYNCAKGNEGDGMEAIVTVQKAQMVVEMIL